MDNWCFVDNYHRIEDSDKMGLSLGCHDCISNCHFCIQSLIHTFDIIPCELMYYPLSVSLMKILNVIILFIMVLLHYAERHCLYSSVWRFSKKEINSHSVILPLFLTFGQTKTPYIFDLWITNLILLSETICQYIISQAIIGITIQLERYKQRHNVCLTYYLFIPNYMSLMG